MAPRQGTGPGSEDEPGDGDGRSSFGSGGWADRWVADKFSRVEEDVRELWTQMRVFGRMAVHLEPKVDDLEEDVAELKADVKDIVNRSVTLRIVIVAAPIVLTCVGLLIAVLTGRLG